MKMENFLSWTNDEEEEACVREALRVDCAQWLHLFSFHLFLIRSSQFTVQLLIYFNISSTLTHSDTCFQPTEFDRSFLHSSVAVFAASCFPHCRFLIPFLPCFVSPIIAESSLFHSLQSRSRLRRRFTITLLRGR
ncbi:hypothetical protein BLNAU_20890 [Blattamonas nauphoetae]|uniref:Uncharacterized protein n=1 Tax=Blattamonas nauphoetae TaxID=2049346 RepID=A0ABQ9WXD5_9EUKA|nr:hypothetical protein BLNAU_20890 [Blattamonas nauphoetae]